VVAERVRYAGTAVRPSWVDLPVHVRDVVVDWIGEPVAWHSAGGGFTRGFASALMDADGVCTFVKAVPFSNVHITASYRREIAVHAVLPADVPVPRLLHSAEVGEGDDGWVVLAFEHVAGRMPGEPWTATDLALAVTALERMADGLRAVEWDDPTALLDMVLEDPEVMTLWSTYDVARLPDDLAAWLDAHRELLVAATARSLEAFRGEGWAHCDVRADNMVLDGGTVWIVDWNWLCHAPAWVDLALLLPQVHADGVDLAVAYSSRLLAAVDPVDVDAAIAWLGALMLFCADQPVFEGGSPWIRPHQLWTGQACLRLLRARWEA
jgi:hypothetical protein